MSLDPDRLSPSDAIQITNAKKAVDIPYPLSLFNQHRCSLQTHDELPHHCYKREEKRDTRKNRNRYRTQPITFDEIKEVDEETIEMGGQTDNQVGSLTNVLRQTDLRMDFLEFSKNLEGAVARKISTTSRQHSAPYGVDNNQTKIVVISRNSKNT